MYGFEKENIVNHIVLQYLIGVALFALLEFLGFQYLISFFASYMACSLLLARISARFFKYSFILAFFGVAALYAMASLGMWHLPSGVFLFSVFYFLHALIFSKISGLDLSGLLLGKREFFTVSLVFFSVLFVFIGGLLTFGGLLDSPSSDVKIIFAGKAQLFADSIKNGRMPFWDPYVQSGAPFFSNPEFTMALYPPNLLLIADLAAFNFLFFAHIFLSGFFMYVFLRNKLGILPSVFGSFSYMLSGYVAATVYAGHYTQLVSLAYLPLMFHFAGKLAETGSARLAVVFGLVLAFIFFGSHMQFFAFGVISALSYFAFSLYGKKSFSVKSAALIVVTLAVFLAVSLVQFAAYVEFKNSIKPYDYGASSYLSFTPVEIVKLLVPNVFGSPEHYLFVTYYWESLFYIGAVAFVMLYMLFAKRKALDGGAKFFIALFSIFLVMSFGKYLPFFETLWSYLPLFSVFRSPVRLIFISVFSLSVLSAYAFSLFQKDDRAERVALSRLSLCVSSFVIALASLGIVFRDYLEKILFYFYSEVFGNMGYVKTHSFGDLLTDRFYPGLNDFVFSAFLAAVIMVSLAASMKMNGRRLLALPVILLVIETGIVSSSLIHADDLESVFKEDSIIKFLGADNGLFRIYNLKKYGAPNYEFYDFFSYKNKLYNIGGDSTLTLRHYDDYFRKAAAEFEKNNTYYMEKLNVKYVISPFYIGNLSLVIDSETAKLYRLDSYFPRAYFMNGGNAEIISYAPGRIVIKTYMKRDDTLVISETYAAGWEAACNGIRTNVSMNEIFVSARLNSACKEVVFEYSAPDFSAFLLISAVSLFVSVLFILLSGKRRQ